MPFFLKNVFNSEEIFLPLFGIDVSIIVYIYKVADFQQLSRFNYDYLL